MTTNQPKIKIAELTAEERQQFESNHRPGPFDASLWLQLRREWLHVEMVERPGGRWAVALILDEGYSEFDAAILESYRAELRKVSDTEGLDAPSAVSEQISEKFW